jgi:AAA+ ATPase superfamily predicted ATPase
VGKTALLRAFCSDKRHVFFVADLGTESASLEEFTRRVSEHVHGRPDAISAFSSWDAAFEYLVPSATDERLVVVIDEFTYLIDANPAVPSILQRLWDTRLADTRMMLVLCGSYVGMMEQHVLAYRAPLYGRRTAQWQLVPLGFWDAQQLMPGFKSPDRVRAFAVLGGVPAYVLQFDSRSSLGTNIANNVLSPGSFLYDEPRFLLLQELRDPRRYFSVLAAIAGGRTRQNEIAQAAGIASSSLPFYLSTLREMGLVERRVPATETHPEKSKRGLYYLRDHLFRFWFRFVYPNRALLERGEVPPIRQEVMSLLDQFTGPAFEVICREHVWRMHGAGTLGFQPRVVGAWWDRSEEIDVVAIGDDDVLLGECKWTKRPVGVNVLDDLKRRAHHIKDTERWERMQYALFARSGFTPALASRASDEGVLLVPLDDIVSDAAA